MFFLVPVFTVFLSTAFEVSYNCLFFQFSYLVIVRLESKGTDGSEILRY